MYHALYLSPMIPSFNIRETADFFERVMDFKIVRDDETYIILIKDQCTVHLLNAGRDIGQMEFYLEVDDIESLWQTMKDKIKGLKVKEPFDREYGMREIHIGIPSTNTLLFIGQEIK
jgi:hypothetical protein